MFKNKIQKLINLRTEGSYWDFKQEWHANKVDLLHDIICMSNNLEDCDAYIIIGVSDDGNVCGVPEVNRKNQQNLIDFLRSIKFAGGMRPTVYVESLELNDESLDVITVKNTANTPYYLDDDYMGLYKGNIYTRIIDTNTPKTGNADIDKVEWLWKKRLGLIGTLERRVKHILLSTGWLCEESDEYYDHFFNEYYPEIGIDVNVDETSLQKEICTEHDSFFYLYANRLFWEWNDAPQTLTRKCFDIFWNGNRVRRFYTICAPKMDFDFVEPKIAFLNTEIGIILFDSVGIGAQYAYFIKDSIEYNMFQVILDLQLQSVHRSEYYRLQDIYCSNVIPIFSDKQEYTEFIEYVFKEQIRFQLEYNNITIDNEMFDGAEAKKDKRIKQSFKLGKLLVEWLINWRLLFVN